MDMADIMKRLLPEFLSGINWRQPKYQLPAVVYIPLLLALYFIIDVFNVEIGDGKADKNLETTEYLNAHLPDAQLGRSDDIGSKWENMTRQFGKISDEYTGVENIERDEGSKEEYDARSGEGDSLAFTENIASMEAMDDEAAWQAARAREQAALAELERSLAEARLKGRRVVSSAQNSNADSVQADTERDDRPRRDSLRPNKAGNDDHESGEESAEVTTSSGKPVTAIAADDAVQEVVKATSSSSNYFHTITDEQDAPRLITAIIDEDITAVDGSRVRLRLLDEIAINDVRLPQGTYLYATMSGFGGQRVKGTVSSVLVGDELVRIRLSIYDTDGMEGLYVPRSSFRDTAKDVASGSLSGGSSLVSSSSSNSDLERWGVQVLSNAYQKSANAISKAIKKNKAKLKYGTQVYLINGGK